MKTYKRKSREERSSSSRAATSAAASTSNKKKKRHKKLSHEDKWDVMFERLEAYQEQNGDCLVPCNYEQDQKLSNWVQRLRSTCKTKLSEEQSERLESIGFVWKSVRRQSWDAMYERLVQYQQEHNHCNVPASYKPDPHLAHWVSAQRREKRNLSPDRLERLEQLGFVWSVYEELWNSNFEALKEYQQLHGDCNVPRIYEPNKQLGQWVRQQRYYNNKLCLSQERVERLLSIGFDFSGKRASSR